MSSAAVRQVIALAAERVRAGQSVGKPANEVFGRLETQLKAR